VRYLALCCDYDGTLAEEGRVSAATRAALQRLRASGRKLLLVTGRILEELQTVCDCLELFDRVVAENGASLYDPATREERLLAKRPPELFIQTLRDRGVQRLSVGRVVVAAWHPDETILLNAIRDLGLELQVIFNKDAVMVLPTGVNKASGLTLALQDLDLSARNIVGVGDAENDYAFLSFCEVGVAVDNALPLLKSSADFVTVNARGAGVVEVIEELLADDLRARASRLARHRVILGLEESGKEVQLRAPDVNALLVGTSSRENSTLAIGLLQRLTAQGYTFCVIDTAGDYQPFEGALTLGTSARAPTLEETQQRLHTYGTSFIVNLRGLDGAARRQFLCALFGQIEKARLRTGRPHWLVISDIHDFLASDPQHSADAGLPIQFDGILRITTHPQSLVRGDLRRVTAVLAVGADPQRALAQVGAILGIAVPSQAQSGLNKNEALYWPIAPAQPPQKIVLPSARGDNTRGSQS
jgi:HAD superfamily hydrolase (TIGR01484 family)